MLFAQEFFEKSARGFFSEKPTADWQDALLCGNGTMGILVPGQVEKEDITMNHAFLYLPGKVSGTYVKQGEHLNEIRDLLFNGKYREASSMMAVLKNETGYNDSRDPYIPGFNLQIEQKSSPYSRYQRSVNYETGEAIVDWQNVDGTLQRRAFVSRADSLMVLQIKGSGKINATFSFESLQPADSKDLAMIVNGFDQIGPTRKDDWLTYKAVYENSNPYAPFAGYQGAGKVVNKGGTLKYDRDKIVVTDADEVLVLVKLEPVVKFTGHEMDPLLKFIASKPIDYESLLSRHAKIQGVLFTAVKLDLNANTNDRNLSSEALIAKSRSERKPPLAMIEKAFDAGRYNIISSSGSNPPNLIGIWSGQWSSPWSGSFTTNGNLPTALSFLLPGNTPSLLLSLFNMNDRLMDGYRRNARELFNCRGIHIPAQMTTTSLETDFTPGYPHAYWTGSAGWEASYYFDYYQYTHDIKFLQDKGYPFMKEAALFLEDFLTIEKDGKYVFVPSYSPENAPGGERNPPACINATMDVMITTQLLKNCIQAADILNTDADKIRKWKDMLTKMPDYQVSPEGTLREWLWSGEVESNNHRHASHLYALYDDSPAEFKTDRLRKAVQRTIDMRFNFHENIGHGTMAFGIAQLGGAAAHIGDTLMVSKIVNFLATHYWSSGMASYHNMHDLFNMDISGGFPYLVSQCLEYSEPGLVSLLPALPADWKSGSVEGLKLRGNILLKKLSWNEKTIVAVLYSDENQRIKVKSPSSKKTVNLKAGKDNQIEFKLK
jgi:alpha-L-fucosidase 2